MNDSDTERRCGHKARGFYRVPWNNGNGQHIVELCQECGSNVRGGGVWVSAGEVRDPASLPLAPGRSEPANPPSLFDTGSASTGAAILKKIRSSGFILTLDANDKPKISPVEKLTPAQRELLKRHRDAIRAALLSERPQPSLLTPFDEPSWEELSSWWLSWEPPTEPYDLGPGVHVSSPRHSYEYHAELLRAGCRGQVELALHDWIKRHYRKFVGEKIA